MEFKEVKLGEISNINMGQSPRSEFYSEFEGTPFLQGNRTFQHIYPLIDTYTNKITKLANKNDILFSVRAPVGDMNIAPVDLCIGRGLCAINSTNSNQEFLFYLLKSKLNELESHSTGTIFSSVNKKTLENFIVKVPSDSHQKNIGRLLSNLDKKIEINQNIIANLQELSQTLFKRWFVDFEFPDENGNPYKSSGGEMVESELGEIPKGWIVNNINDFANNNVITGKTPSTKVKENYSETGIPFLTIPDMHKDVFALNTERYISETGIEKLEKKILEKNSLAISCIATPGLVSITSNDTLTNQQINSFTPNKNELYYLYFTLKGMRTYIRDLGSGGSATLNLNKTQFAKIKLVKPINELLLKYDKLVSPNFEIILNFQKENNYLTQLRDTLLPKLMSGEIEIPDDIEVNEDELSI